MMKRCYFFGAGAEVGFNLSVGGDFASNVILGDSDMDAAIQKYYCEIADNLRWYPSYNAYSFKEEQLLEASIRKKYLNEESDITYKKEYEDQIKSELERMNKKDEKDKKDEKIEKDKKEVLEKYPSYMGILDNNFHTIISPRHLGSQRFWKVVRCYTRAYLSLAVKIVNGDKKISGEDYTRILENPKWAYETMLSKCASYENQKSYYKILKDIEKGKSKIITSNYTPFARCLAADNTNDNIAYMNGRFGLLESAYRLCVYDVEKDELPEDVLFPYIFIQSGIKPIVDISQLREHKKIVDMYDNTDEMVILGYKLNSDDNHINSIIRSYLVSGKKVTIFAYDSQIDTFYVERQLRIKKEQVDLDIKYINKGNCFDEFEKYVSC